MKEYTVRWLISAAKDLQEIRAYLEQEAPEMAEVITSEIYEAAEGLNFMPTRWRFDDENPQYRRRVVLDKYKIFFRIVGQFVQVNYIRHTFRDSRGLQNDVVE